MSNASRTVKRSRPNHLPVTRLLALLLLVLLIASCSPTTPASSLGSQATSVPSRTITIDALDYSFKAPDSLAAGWTTIVFKNGGQEPHHAQLLRLNDGVTMEQFQTAMQGSPDAILALVSGEGGPGVIDPGQTYEVIVNLPAGQYVMMCFVESSDHVAHAAKGMVKPFQVTAATGSAVTEPATKGAITMKDFTFDFPAEMPAGRNAYKVVNQGPQLHELSLVRLEPGKTIADFQAFVGDPNASGPPPFTNAGGMQALSTTKEAIAILDLQAGEYVALCFVPDPATGKSHVEMGMVKPFTVK